MTALEYASGKTAEVMGKPDEMFYQSAQAKLNCPLTETVMIGDVWFMSICAVWKG